MQQGYAIHPPHVNERESGESTMQRHSGSTPHKRDNEGKKSHFLGKWRAARNPAPRSVTYLSTRNIWEKYNTLNVKESKGFLGSPVSLAGLKVLDRWIPSLEKKIK
ncbi:hypothetical protein Fot_11162 [Forsythia ovata]|uniref:Uncharacterized protein n=1 Tax=Forsythia ovata TaxID=205694 RepID=A0ABD1WJB2_9LAMI